MRRFICAMILAAVCFAIAGCGETIHGAGKDLSRMGKGVKTFFIRED